MAGRSEALKPALLSLLVRGAYLAVAWALSPDFSAVGRYDDSSSYLVLANAFQTGEWADLTLQARKFWPGYPMAVAMFSGLLHLSTPTAAIGVSILAASGSTYLVARLHGARVAVLFACLPPDWVFYGSLIFSEALATLLIWLSIFLLSRTRRYDLGIGVASLAALARPQGVFLLAALGIQGIRERRTRSVVMGGVFAAAVAASWFLYLYLKTGEPFSSLTGYGAVGQWRGFPMTIPFASVAHELFANRVAWVRKVYLVGLWAVTLWAAVVGVRRMRSATEPVVQVESIFLLVFAAYFACENSAWGFTAFSRFVIPVSPVVLAAFGERLPPGKWAYGVACSISFALAVAIFLRSPAGPL
ncbi:MAG: hypothetical protein HYT87_17400 [Nitrospirae bacterium]|nr:hypothetical protein [Nitrospirota bacterium]